MNILIAYDGSGHADAAIDDLALAGLPDHANALVLSVLDAWLPGASPSGGKADEALPGLKEIRDAVMHRVEAQRAIAEKGAARVRTLFPGWRVAADACAESPAAEIIRRAEGEHGGVDGRGARADLTVVGSRGLGAISRLVLGSVAQKVMHGLRGSLRVVRDRAGVGPSAGITRTLVRPVRILVGVDGSADSDAAVAAVAARSWPEGTHVLVASFEQAIQGLEHSNAASLSVFGEGGIWPGEVAGAAWAGESWAAQAAATAAGTIRERCRGVQVSSVVRLGDPSYALIEEAANWSGGGAGVLSEGKDAGADCVFVGARGVRGLERFLLGSVSAAVAMNAHCSVEIVHRRPAHVAHQP
jgi:nucleotide-binding universal stress UspA family protein